MRVLVVSNMYPHLGNSSLGIFVKQQVDSLRAKGIDVDVLFINGPQNKLNYFWGVFRFWQKLRENHVDLIHAHYIYPGVIARMQFRCPVVLTFHSGELLTRSWLEPRLSKALSPWVKAVVAVSQQVKEALGKANAYVIPCGVDLELFAPRSQMEARRRLDLPLDRKLVLFAAANRPEKRRDLVEKAVLLLHQRRPEVELVVASGQPPQTMPYFMNACDVLVLASDKEGSPQVVKEAMACNLPVVSVRVGDVEEMISGVPGCYLAERTADDIALKLDLALERGERSQGRPAVSHLALDRIADRLIHVYQEALGQ